ncbi:MAG: [FeFe] hydrogenase H-cluster maturation GTPase HydF [Dorea sp.]|jgi:[FeFe] hydrogenase H-cluster maturation GTPase HydF|nr:[FeFe] hydrogenase H-cluster maturation GTPase HydF [Dorea sp.]
MSLNTTPSAERIHIGIFGRRNAGKSSVINALTGQNLSIVSGIKGTTTDPVLKSMELLPLGPVVMIDTPGLDDEGELGALRVRKARQVLNKTDIAVLVVDGTAGIAKEDVEIFHTIRAKSIPCIIVLNKADLVSENDMPAVLTSVTRRLAEYAAPPVIWVSTAARMNIEKLKEQIASLIPVPDTRLQIVGDLLKPSDLAVLVVPIDKAAPKGRLILPQQQTIRDILEAGAVSVVTRDTELKQTLASLGKTPALVITDSQVFEQVAADVPEDIPLTSFSILFARYKGNLQSVVDGARTLDLLNDGDTILISEGCTHHRQCEDIGTVKLPNFIRKHTAKEINFEFTSGTEFPLDLQKYRLIIHCGGCTLNEREMRYRQKCAEDAEVPMTNYGIAIAHMKGILKRSVSVFPVM